MVRRRLTVLGIWLLLLFGGAASASRLPSLLSDSVTVPGTPSATADSILEANFGQNPNGTFTIVLPLSRATRSHTPALSRRLRAAVSKISGAHVTDLQVAAGLLYANMTTPFDLQHAAELTPSLRRSLRRGGLAGAEVTGAPAIQHDILPVLAGDLRRGELIALPILIIMLFLVMGPRPMALLPLAVAGATVYTSLLCVFVLAHATLVVSYVPNLVELIGLGVSVDYSLLVARRFREETDLGQAAEQAIVSCMRTTGRAAIVSGGVVAASLTAILILPVPFIQSLGVTGVIVPVVAVLALVTLQPALLSLVSGWASRPLWPAQIDAFRGMWDRLGAFVIRRRFYVFPIGLLLLIGAAAPAGDLSLTAGSTSGIPASLTASAGLKTLEDRVGAGPIAPIQIEIDSGKSGGVTTKAASRATLRLANEILNDPESFLVAIGPKAPYVDSSGRYRREIVVGHHDFGAPQTGALVRRIRNKLIPAARFPSGFAVWVGGAPAEAVDFVNRTYAYFPVLALLISAISYVILLFAFRSALLPLLALILDAVSAGAAYGSLVVVFQLGVGHRWFGLYHASAIEAWIPIFLLAILFGLSMDYQIFLVSRVREAKDHGETPASAVATGLARTGGVISAAAVIMVSAFAGFVMGQIGGLQEFGVGVAVAIILDVTLIRLLVLPSLLAILGQAIWWSPFSGPGGEAV